MIEKWMAFTIEKKILFSSILLSAVILVSFTTVFLVKQSEYKTAYAENEQRIEQLNSSIDETNAIVKKVEESAATMECIEKGQAVVAILNEYPTLKTTSEKNENTRKVNEFFDRECGVYRVQGSNVDCEWEFVTDYYVDGDMIDTLWLCRNKYSGKLECYARVKYDVTTGLFSSLSSYSTGPNSSFSWVPVG